MRGPVVVLAAAACSAACSGGAAAPVDAASPDAGAPDAFVPGFELVGHSDLGARGMNAALAVAGTHVYVGSRTDGERHANAGVLIVDVRDPAAPEVVGAIGAPDEGLFGMSSRELRAIPERDLLLVLNIYCGEALHDCGLDMARFPATGGVAETDNLKVYDITDREAPALVATYDFTSYPGYDAVRPHELFLWRDPVNAGRDLLFVAAPGGPPALQVLDVSDISAITRIAAWDAPVYTGINPDRSSNSIHSLSVSPDGTVGYLAHLASGFFMVDLADVAANLPAPEVRLLTPIAQRVDYSPPLPPATHSAVPIPGRDLVLLTDEVYPAPSFEGCPWGWARIVGVNDPALPLILSEYKLPENDVDACPADGAPLVNFTAHNPTVTEHLALITWHAGGLQVVDTSDATAPRQIAAFLPQPLASVATEDPQMRGNPITMWSYPVVKDGLVYVVDIRNGLYILRYHGPYEAELAVEFVEGNSNL